MKFKKKKYLKIKKISSFKKKLYIRNNFDDIIMKIV